MAVNKVIYDGETLMDVTDSTVTEENLLSGAVAYNAAGERIVGAVVTVPVDDVPTEDSMNAVTSGGVFAAVESAKKWENIEGKPFEMVGGGDTVTWDGNLAGRTYIENGAGILVRVSNAVPSAEDLAAGGTCTLYSSHTGTTETAEWSADDVEDDGAGTLSLLQGLVFIATEEASENMAASGIYIPAGVYFVASSFGYVAPRSLTINGYSGFVSEKLDTEALQVEKLPLIVATGLIADGGWFFQVQPSEIFAAVDSGRDVKLRVILDDGDESGVLQIGEFSLACFGYSSEMSTLVQLVFSCALDTKMLSVTITKDDSGNYTCVMSEASYAPDMESIVNSVIEALPKYNGEVESA